MTSAFHFHKMRNQPRVINDKVSVIIPVYNVEPWLAECLDSLINQTYENIEIICVNDGSKDKSLDILKEYQQKDGRIVVIDQKNQGASAARNAGIRASTGNYITFVDSDDYVDLSTYELCMNKISETGADVLEFDYIYFPNRDNNRAISTKVYKNNSFAAITNNDYNNFIWNKVYKRSLIVDNGIYFREDVSYCEDDLFILMLYPKANNIVPLSQKLYYYRQRENSLGNFTDTSHEKLARSVVARGKHLIDDWQAHGYNYDRWLLDKVSWAAEYIDRVTNEKLKISWSKDILTILENRLLSVVNLEGMHETVQNNIEILRKYANA